MAPVIPCHDFDVLCWFLAHSDFSIIYADTVPSAKPFPVDLHEVAAVERGAVVDLAITSTDTLSKFVNEPVNPGTTAVFMGGELVAVLRSLLATQETVLADWFLSLHPDFKKMKQAGRAAVLNPIVKQMVVTATMGGGEEATVRHKWTEPEMDQTIDLHLAYRSNNAGRTQAIEELSRNLKLSVGQITMAVDAVGTLDPEEPRRYPKPSKKLARLWKKRGLGNKAEQ
jgi:hypothetical protein